MTYRDHLKHQTSYSLYHDLSNFVRAGGDLEGADLQLFEAAGESHIDDESYKEALMDLIERLHDADLM